MDIDRSAPVIVELTTVIDAPIETVWAVHADVDAWAGWHPDIVKAVLDGPPAEGASSTWETHGLTITSTIQDLVPQERIAWGGVSSGIDGRHVWTFRPTAEGTEVHTAESWSGRADRRRPGRDGGRAASLPRIVADGSQGSINPALIA